MIEQKKLADPSTLGLAAFVVSQSLLNIPNAHLVPVSATPLFLTVALICGGCIQLLCAIFEYARGHRFGMTTFGIYGGFFISLGLFVYFELNGILKFGHASGTALGTFLLVWAILTIPFTMASFRESKPFGWMFLFVELAFIGGTLSELAGVNSAFGGWAGIISSAIGLYLVYRGLMEATEQSKVHVVQPLNSYADSLN
ncbi:acetate uptake transporter [Aneurinibacillus sp. Ricciae_BoGa-3]|uniref:acetate uptake transporter n=1 Tax=Aneurinibacillus sp. Ricciae_BoGa-3 TaxID=3022697 RepID=UPI0023426E9D|nr:acetate uptake transporter [Aneurinibacillus sp. Ricciae_BoGa-3]WCK52451.1 acetate uptake transporter [Aneurinibacillus sp. Ricciae_BoGa-3]